MSGPLLWRHSRYRAIAGAAPWSSVLSIHWLQSLLFSPLLLPSHRFWAICGIRPDGEIRRRGNAVEEVQSARKLNSHALGLQSWQQHHNWTWWRARASLNNHDSVRTSLRTLHKWYGTSATWSSPNALTFADFGKRSAINHHGTLDLRWSTTAFVFTHLNLLESCSIQDWGRRPSRMGDCQVSAN